MMLSPDGSAALSPDDPFYRKPPYNIEVEQALLGAVLLQNAALERAGDLAPAHFFDPLHSDIYDSIQQTVAAGRLASPVTLKTVFEDRPAINGLNAAQYLGNLAAAATSIANVPDYAKTIRALALRRALIIIGEDLVASSYDGAVTTEPATIIEEVESNLLRLVEDGPKGSEEISLGEAAQAALQKASDTYKRGGGLRGLSTGLVDLDDKLGGMAPTDLIILGGRPGIGKTALATTIAVNVAIQHMKTVGREGGFVHFFSQEMSAEQLATRIISNHAEVNAAHIGRGKFSETQFRRMADAVEFLREASFVVDQTGGLSLNQLQARARRMKRRKNTGLIVVDYLQLMTGSSKENRTQELTKITNGLKALAKELHLPILALSQLSRGVESREEKRPTLSDLRESGSIEQDADIVMFAYRDEYYVNLRKPDETDIEKSLAWNEEFNKVKGKAEAILAKNRHGPTGTVNLAFNSDLAAFGNIARNYEQPRHP